MTIADKLLTTGQAAKVLGVTIRQARVYAEDGQVRAIHTPHGWLLDAEDVALFAAERARRRKGAQPPLSLTLDDNTLTTASGG